MRHEHVGRSPLTGTTSLSPDVRPSIVQSHSRVKEGTIISGRSWREYEILLRIEPQALHHTSAINVGCGSSHIGKELSDIGFYSSIIDLDLNYDPYNNSFRKTATKIAKTLDGLARILPQGWGHDTCVDTKRMIAGTEGRTLIQSDARHLPFADRTFPYVLALWSTYQIPVGDKRRVFSEFLRVADTVHIGPIFGNDYRILHTLAAEKQFHMVLCQPFYTGKYDAFDVRFSSPGEYELYWKNHSLTHRIKPPLWEEAYIELREPHPLVRAEGGSIIILQRGDQYH